MIMNDNAFNTYNMASQHININIDMGIEALPDPITYIILMYAFRIKV